MLTNIYSTTGKMLQLELHQPVKWLHHRQSLKRIHLTIFFSVSAGIAKNMVDFDSRKTPRRKHQNQPAPGKGMLKFCIPNRDEVGKMQILTIKETEQRRWN